MTSIVAAPTDHSTAFRRKYSFKPRMFVDMFCKLVPGETSKLEYGKGRKGQNKDSTVVSYKPRHIPIPYVWLISQLIYENAIGQKSYTYEAQHRGSYAGHILDAVGEELNACPSLEIDGPDAQKWHSTVLMPILQHQIYGIPDTITSWVDCRILCVLEEPDNDSEDDDNDRVLTVSDAAKFYLGTNPLDPSIIPTL